MEKKKKSNFYYRSNELDMVCFSSLHLSNIIKKEKLSFVVFPSNFFQLNNNFEQNQWYGSTTSYLHTYFIFMSSS